MSEFNKPPSKKLKVPWPDNLKKFLELRYEGAKSLVKAMEIEIARKRKEKGK